MSEYDDRVLLAESIYAQVDRARFGISFSSNNAVVTIYWKEAEKNAMRHEFRKAVRKISVMQRGRSGIAMLRASSSFTLGHYNLDEIMVSSTAWSLWLSAWVYGEKPGMALPVSYVVPKNLTPGAPLKRCGGVWRAQGLPTAVEESTDEGSFESAEDGRSDVLTTEDE